MSHINSCLLGLYFAFLLWPETLNIFLYTHLLSMNLFVSLTHFLTGLFSNYIFIWSPHTRRSMCVSQYTSEGQRSVCRSQSLSFHPCGTWGSNFRHGSLYPQSHLHGPGISGVTSVLKVLCMVLFCFFSQGSNIFSFLTGSSRKLKF